MNKRLYIRRSRRGISLLEVLVLVVAIGIIGGAAGTALQTMVKAPSQTDAFFQVETQLISKMEEVRGKDFASIAVGTATDTVTINNVNYTRTVTVALADANGDGSADSNFKQVTVTCDTQSISTLIAGP